MSHWEWNVFSPSSRFNPCLWVKVCLYKGDGKSTIIVLSKVQSKNIQEFVWWNFSSKVWSDSYVCICAGKLGRVINKLKQERNITPKLLIIRGGYDNTEPFERYLIEEQDVDGSGIATGMGFVSFLDQITHDVVKFMKWRIWHTVVSA